MKRAKVRTTLKQNDCSIGDMVKCMDNQSQESHLTISHAYAVIGYSGYNSLLIICDAGQKGAYNSDRFELTGFVAPTRPTAPTPTFKAPYGQPPTYDGDNRPVPEHLKDITPYRYVPEVF